MYFVTSPNTTINSTNFLSIPIASVSDASSSSSSSSPLLTPTEEVQESSSWCTIARCEWFRSLLAASIFRHDNVSASASFSAHYHPLSPRTMLIMATASALALITFIVLLLGLQAVRRSKRKKYREEVEESVGKLPQKDRQDSTCSKSTRSSSTTSAVSTVSATASPPQSPHPGGGGGGSSLSSSSTSEHHSFGYKLPERLQRRLQRRRKSSRYAIDIGKFVQDLEANGGKVGGDGRETEVNESFDHGDEEEDDDEVFTIAKGAEGKSYGSMIHEERGHDSGCAVLASTTTATGDKLGDQNLDPESAQTKSNKEDDDDDELILYQHE